MHAAVLRTRALLGLAGKGNPTHARAAGCGSATVGALIQPGVHSSIGIQSIKVERTGRAYWANVRGSKGSQEPGKHESRISQVVLTSPGPGHGAARLRPCRCAHHRLSQLAGTLLRV